MKTTNAVSWHPLAGLPEELREQLATDATIELRRDGKHRSDRRWQLMMVPGIACLIAGSLAGLLIPSGPVPSPVQLALLVVGAVCFAVWLDWFRGSSSRPLPSQGLLATPSTLVLIDHTSVGVVRAEHVDVDHGKLLIARELIHRADEIFLDQITRAQSADLETRQADPWRAFANTAGGRPMPAPRTHPLGRAALRGLAAACVLELVFVIAIGWRASSQRADSWDRVDAVLGAQLTTIDRHQERAFVERLAEPQSTEAMALLLGQAGQLDEHSGLRDRVLQRYRLKLADELGKTDEPTAIEDKLQFAIEHDLPEQDRKAIRGRLGASWVALAAASQDADLMISALEGLARGEISGAPREAILARLTTVADATTAAVSLDRGAQLYAAMSDRVPSAHPMRQKLLARLRELVAAELPSMTDAYALYRRFGLVRRLVPDTELKAMIDGHFETLMRDQVASITDTELLLNYYELRLNDKFDAFLTQRFEDVALAEIQRARSAEAIDHFTKEAEVLGLSGEFKSILAERLRALGAP